MDIDLIRLRNGIDSKVIVNENYSFSEEELKGSGILKLDNVKIDGEITLDAMDELYLSLSITGSMDLPCSITLEPVLYPIDILVEGTLDELTDENVKKSLNTIDILPIIWENILVEVPMRVVSPNADPSKMHGDGWKLITGEEENVNSELSKLEDLLKTSEVS
jgi:uncharacterized metal-binding protein YceD (DUF177 family)